MCSIAVLAPHSATPYICNNSVSVVGSHEVLHFGWRSIFKSVTANEVVRDFVFFSPARLAIGDGNGSVAIASAMAI